MFQGTISDIAISNNTLGILVIEGKGTEAQREEVEWFDQDL